MSSKTWHQYGFTVMTSSPYFSQVNEKVESAVKLAKHMLLAPEPDIALLNMRLPALPTVLSLQTLNDTAIQAGQKDSKIKAKVKYDKHHRACLLTPRACGDKVFVCNDNKWSKSGVVLSGDTTNGKYLVNTNTGV